MQYYTHQVVLFSIKKFRSRSINTVRGCKKKIQGAIEKISCKRRLQEYQLLGLLQINYLYAL